MSRNRRIAQFLASSALAGACAALTPVLGQDNSALSEFGAEDVNEILFEADDVYREVDGGPITAEGDVRAFFGERYLRADRLVYDPANDIVTAEGNVSITDQDMETIFAGRVRLSGDLRDGVAENFSALLEDNARLAAASAVQERGARTRLNRAVYTACNVCDKDGNARTPTWRIKSLRVTRDLERKVVRFHHAFFEIKGVPILYTPFLQGPDPSVDRQSGFLTPRVGASSRLGFNFELPYYFALSDSEDATFNPKYTATDGVLWQGEYRRHFKRGYHVLQGGVIDFNNEEDREDDIPGVRWHYFGRGYQEFAQNWRASYDFERVSDDTYLRRYNIERTGDLTQTLNRGNTNQLRSNGRIARTTENSRLSIDTYLFQGLRAQDDSATTPLILPLIDYRKNFGRIFAGGTVDAGANIASIYRTGGTDSQRFTASLDWDRNVITPSGHRFHLFAQARGDAYLFQDLDQGTEICSNPLDSCAVDFPALNSGDASEFEARFAPTAGIEWSYPLAKDIPGGRLMLEPRVQLVASPSGLNDDIIVNEDSQSIEFDYAGLFDFNKATGYDAFEDGQRANIGLAASATWDNGIEIDGAIGRQYRLQSTDAFDPSSGLGSVSSDFVGSVNLRYKNRFGIENRFRIDGDTGAFDRAESLAYFRAGPLSGNASYVRLNEENVNANLVRREELSAAGRLKITDHWSVGGAWRLDLQPNALRDPDTGILLPAPGVRTIRQDFNIGYQDECSAFAVTYRRDRTRTTNLEPDEAFLVTFTLKSLVSQ